MKSRTSCTVCVVLNFETIRVPSARRIWREVIGCEGSTESIGIDDDDAGGGACVVEADVPLETCGTMLVWFGNDRYTNA